MINFFIHNNKNETIVFLCDSYSYQSSSYDSGEKFFTLNKTEENLKIIDYILSLTSDRILCSIKVEENILCTFIIKNKQFSIQENDVSWRCF